MNGRLQPIDVVKMAANLVSNILFVDRKQDYEKINIVNVTRNLSLQGDQVSKHLF